MAVEFILGMLFVIPVGLLVVALPQWPEGQSVARVVASEAARAAVQQNSWGDAQNVAEAVKDEVVTSYGYDAGDVDVTLSGALARGERITATVRIRMPAIAIPGIGAVEAWDWTAARSEQVDLYRSFG